MGNKASTATQWEVPNSDTGSLDHRSQQGPAAHVERWAEQMDTLNAARERQAVIQEATTVGRRVTPHITFNPPAPSVPPARPAPPAPRAPRLPELCSRHGSREGCVDANCRRLHLCHLFLADICKFGDACRNGHSLTTVHNQVVCNRFGLDTSRELAAVQMLRLAFQETGRMPDEIRHKYLDVCYKAGSPNPCQEPLCNRLHICRMFVTGRCNRPACKHGHDLHTTHNNDVLSRHKATRLSDAAILDLLREKCSGRRQGGGDRHPGGGPRRQQQRGAAGGGGQVEARARASSGGQGSGGGQMNGIAEELQCPVCLDMLQRATTLGCGHTFCEECLRDVRENDPKCPMCRERITSSIRSVTLDNVISSLAAHR
ncbi:uncharacterized protein LOC119095347 [Pollicipes pollicipes]|uniref:uncharacterized protein LOC119095347 n=1 Tax=Pollicipes pollicipes TaxID=41117 RepID=UPI001884CAA1|nr:uncharacterized protein LOC119095347 [Pollicipes pollicipes]